jgi:hypothetical protein
VFFQSAVVRVFLMGLLADDVGTKNLISFGMEVAYPDRGLVGQL